MEKMDKPLFNTAFATRVRRAIELNRGEPGDIYHHPSEQKIVRKCIDLSCRKPLHAIGNEPTSNSEEKWLEAYLIRKAKRNGWVLDLTGRRFRFLYSQLNFRGTESERPRPLDLLLYESDTGNLVVMELKAKRELVRAKKELDYYSEQVGKHSEEIATVFSLGKIQGVSGYIIWPQNERDKNTKHLFDPYGVIEYSRVMQAWERFKVLGEKLTIKFICIKAPQQAPGKS